MASKNKNKSIKRNKTSYKNNHSKTPTSKPNHNKSKLKNNSNDGGQEKNIKTIKNLILNNKHYLIILLSYTFLIYINSLWGELIADDIPGFVNNPTAQSFSMAMKKFWFHEILYSISYHFFKLSPFPLHLISILNHLLNVILAFIVLNYYYNKKIAFYATVLFATHPVNVEAVAWISASNYLRTTTLILLQMIILYKYYTSKNRKYLYYSFSLYVISLTLFRVIWMLTLPFIVITAYLLLLERNFQFKKILNFSYLYILSLIYVFFDIYGKIQNRIQEITGVTNNAVELPNYFLRIRYSLYKMSELLIFPKNLSLYQEGEVINQTKVILMTVNLIFILLLLIFLFINKNKYILATVLIIFLSILPVFSPVQVAWFMTERYLYFASIFYSVLLVMFLNYLSKKFKNENIGITVLVTIILLFSIKAVVRNYEWSTNKRLWEATAKVSPNSARVYNNLGDVYGKELKYDLAILNFEKAINLNPNYAEAMHNLGNTYLELNNLEMAEKWYLKSYEKNPYIYQTPYKLAMIYISQEKYDEAKKFLEYTLQISPNYKPALDALNMLQ